MVLYRQHRGWLDDSMGTVREVTSIDDIRVIEADRAEWGEDLTQIEVRPYGYDKRIEWDTHIVTVSGRIIGFTNGPLP